MDAKTSAPSPVIIGQDEASEIRIQAPPQSGRRHIDIRLWKRGASGFAPSGTGLTLHAADLNALREAIVELLEVSNGAHQVARVVYDVNQGRRLRAELEPFGTRFVARLGFWQQVRDSWRPADDGLVLFADHLRSLHQGLDRFAAWMLEVSQPPSDDDRPSAHREALIGWPSPGADWITLEPDRIAFHPRGVRITFTVVEQDTKHWVAVRQWRRQESLWVPEPVQLPLAILDLDQLIAVIRRLNDNYVTGEALVPDELSLQDGSALRVEIRSGQPDLLSLDQRLPEREDRIFAFEDRVALPAEHLSRFGRALAQSWSMLLGWLSDGERDELQQRALRERVAFEGEPEATALEVSVSAGQESTEPGAETLAELSSESGVSREAESTPAQAAEETSADSVRPEPARRRRLIGDQVFHFGAESETPGIVVPAGDCVRIVVEGFLLPRGIELPLDVVAIVISGLERLNQQRQKQSRIDPVLLCDRENCAIYARLGTSIRPAAIELRVWTGSTTSEAVSFESMYLDDLLDGLRRALDMLGVPLPSSSPPLAPPPPPPDPVVQPTSPARRRHVAAAAPPVVPGPILAAPDAEPEAPLSIVLQTIRLGDHSVTLRLRGYSQHPTLALEWRGQYFDLPVDDLQTLLQDLRDLYYDALRGRRGRTLTIGEYPVVSISVRNQGADLFIRMQQEIDGEVTALTFPAAEVPLLLDAARAALDHAAVGYHQADDTDGHTD